MRHRNLIVVAALAAGVCAALMFPVQVLEVSSRRGGQVLWRAPVSTGEVFSFDYIHSIELTPVQGRFAVEPDEWLRLVETRFPSYGAGLPLPAPGESADGRWMVAPGGQRMPEFSFYISPINQARLSVGERTLDLPGRVDAGDVAVIAVGRRPFLLTHLGPH
jgi:hypothetical protein